MDHPLFSALNWSSQQITRMMYQIRDNPTAYSFSEIPDEYACNNAMYCIRSSKQICDESPIVWCYPRGELTVGRSTLRNTSVVMVWQPLREIEGVYLTLDGAHQASWDRRRLLEYGSTALIREFVSLTGHPNMVAKDLARYGRHDALVELFEPILELSICTTFRLEPKF